MLLNFRLLLYSKIIKTQDKTQKQSGSETSARGKEEWDFSESLFIFTSL